MVGILLSKISLYYHTIKYLKPSQIFWRLRYRIIPLRANLSLCFILKKKEGHWVLPIEKPQSFMVDGTFKLLNDSKQLQTIGWDDPNREKLWRYNQHYFDDLNAIGSSERYYLHIDLMLDWIRYNNLGKGTGWEPYPTSLRIVNWIKWCLSGNKMPDKCLKSLSTQANWLNRNIEWHILGNHLFANAKALIFAGLFFDNDQSKKWLKTGLNILASEIKEQILPDGGHFELSPMYHSIILEDVLDLINLFRTFPCKTTNVLLVELQSLAPNMLRWLETMCHPDGKIAFFNDAAFNIAASPDNILLYSNRLKIDYKTFPLKQNTPLLKPLSDSGYLALEVCHAKALLDVASIGPDYLPGHGHADVLSFELSLFGKRTLVNRGISQYGTGITRQRERETSSHNTVVINNENSSEVWSGFRVAQRARPFGLMVDQNKNSIKVSCSHDGYRRLSGRPVHQRSWSLTNNALLIEDEIQGLFKTATAHFHFHPDIELVSNDIDGCSIKLPGFKKYVNLVVRKGSPRIVESIFSPEFGIQLLTKCLEVQFDGSDKIAVEISWAHTSD